MPEARGTIRVACRDDSDHFELTHSYRGPPEVDYLERLVSQVFTDGQLPERCPHPHCFAELAVSGGECVS